METSVPWKFESSSCFYGNCLILIVPSLLDCVTLIRFTGLINVVLITNNDRSNQPDHSTRLEVVTQSPGFNMTPYDASCWYKWCVVTEVCCHRGGKNQTFTVIKRRLGNPTSNVVVGGAEHEQCFIIVLYFILWISVTAKIKLPSNHTKVRPETLNGTTSAAGFIYKFWASCREQWWKNNPVGRNLLLTQSGDTAVGDGWSF